MVAYKHRKSFRKSFPESLSYVVFLRAVINGEEERETQEQRKKQGCTEAACPELHFYSLLQ